MWGAMVSLDEFVQSDDFQPRGCSAMILCILWDERYHWLRLPFVFSRGPWRLKMVGSSQILGLSARPPFCGVLLIRSRSGISRIDLGTYYIVWLMRHDYIDIWVCGDSELKRHNIEYERTVAKIGPWGNGGWQLWKGLVGKLNRSLQSEWLTEVEVNGIMKLWWWQKKFEVEGGDVAVTVTSKVVPLVW